MARMIADLIEFLQQPMLRRLYAVAWVTLAAVTLLQSSGAPVVGPPAPPGAPSQAREYFLTGGHIIAFALMLLLIWWALRPAPHALIAALVCCLIFGWVTEAAQQLVPDRSASIDDLLVDWAASGIAALVIYWGRFSESSHR